jgi:hypothetical protein
VAAVNRTVLVTYRDYRVLTSIGQFSRTDACPHSSCIDSHVGPNYQNNSSGWTCKNFQVTQKDMNTTDFYIFTDPAAINDHQARWILDCADNINESQEMFAGKPILVNDKINSLLGEDNETIIWLHVLTSSKSFITYLIAVPRGTNSEEVKIEYLNPQPCYFIFRVWME